MLVQLALGTGLILITVILGGGAYWTLELLLAREYRWLHRAPSGPRPIVALILAVFWTMALMTACVWVWALAFWILDLFPTMEEAVYFSLVAFTTLGFGDVLLPEGWRLLAGLSAANGLLYFGLMTAMLVEVMRNLRPRWRDPGRKSR